MEVTLSETLERLRALNLRWNLSGTRDSKSTLTSGEALGDVPDGLLECRVSANWSRQRASGPSAQISVRLYPDFHLADLKGREHAGWLLPSRRAVVFEGSYQGRRRRFFSGFSLSSDHAALERFIREAWEREVRINEESAARSAEAQKREQADLDEKARRSFLGR